MIDWGISAGKHNAALAVFKDKALVFASESERYSKIKNDSDLSKTLIDEALSYGSPDRVFWYERPLLTCLRQHIAGQKEPLFRIKKYLNKHNINVSIKTTSHHTSHAAAGFFTSPFKEACIVVIDAIGEFDTLSIWHAKGTSLKRVYSLQYPNSIGLWYSAMTQRCGLKPNEEEYILMGRSALGNPQKYYKLILEDFVDIYNLKIKANLHRGCLWWRPELNTEKDINDIAAATQLIYEELFYRVLQIAHNLTQCQNLVLGGGCALNCVANKHSYSFFDNVWILPAPGDNGSAIGCVLAHYKQHIVWPGPYLGHYITPLVDNKRIIDFLVQNKICGIARGRAEFGPRALGNRSLIGDPRCPLIKDKINTIKHRESFRPFAPAILEEHAHKFFDLPKGKSSRYMQFTYSCRYPDLFPAITHHDNTSRIQTVPKDGSLFRKLLEEWYERTECPMLLNTSLNIKGESILNDSDDIKRWETLYGVKVFT
jgi:carbamoyltransferase